MQQMYIVHWSLYHNLIKIKLNKIFLTIIISLCLMNTIQLTY